MYSAMALIFAIWTLARGFAIFFQDLLQTSEKQCKKWRYKLFFEIVLLFLLKDHK